MLVNVKTDSHTFGCRLSPSLCGLLPKQSPKTQWDRRQTRFNRSRGRRGLKASLSGLGTMHYRLRLGGKVHI